MVDSAPLQPDGQASQSQTSDPYSTSPVSDDSLSFGDSLKALGKAWVSSIFVKILFLLLVAIIVLFVIFIMITVGYTASKSNCDKDLNSEKNRNKACQTAVLGLRDDKAVVERQINIELSAIDSLTKEISDLNKNIEKLKNDIKDQEPKITEKQKELDALAATEKEWMSKKSGLEDEKTHKETELNTKKEELAKRTTELEQKEKTKQYFIYADVAAGGIDLISLGAISYLRWKLNDVEDKANDAEQKNSELQGQIVNIYGRINSTIAAIEILKEQKAAINISLVNCNEDIKTERERLETCHKEEEVLHTRAKILLELGLDQVVAQILLDDSNHRIKAEVLYDSHDRGFEKTIFFNIVGTKHPLLIVANTTHGYVFGAFISRVLESTNNEYLADKEAFTFSTTNHKVCIVKDPEKAIKMKHNVFFVMGDDEIIIHESQTKQADASATAKRTYQCDTTNEHEFYAESGEFTITELKVYHLIVSHPEEI